MQLGVLSSYASSQIKTALITQPPQNLFYDISFLSEIFFLAILYGIFDRSGVQLPIFIRDYAMDARGTER